MKQESCNSLQPDAKADSASHTVLVVDDDAFMRLTFREALEEAGCRVEEACDGEAAIVAFQRLRPDLVILDLMMPGMDGFETCAALRNLVEGRHTPILAVTGLNDTASLHQAFEAGATDFVTKPVSGALLGYRARHLLRTGRALEELVRREADLRLLKAAVESLPIGITISDAKGKIIYTNPAEAAMHGFEVEELLHREANVLAPQRLHRTLFLEKLEKCGVWRRESVNRRKGGEEFMVQLSSVSVRSPHGEFLGIITACEDITERKKNEEQIHQLAYFDTLTGLPNRALFLDRLQKSLALADRSGKTVAVLFLDLDNFKDINDTQGHDFGDKLLTEVARRLSGCIRDADTLARLGGDEFVVMLAADGHETAGITALRILETFRCPFDIEGRRTYAGFSIGIAIYPDDASDLEGLLRSADAAMYQAKGRGRQNFQFFSAKMNARIVERVSMEADLRQTLEQEDLVLFYQPQWDLLTGRHCGVEVLLRWRHPELGEISPNRFIPLAESSGQIFRLGEWALRSACTQASAWVQAGRSVGRIAVNISGHQLRQNDFPDLIRSILADTNLDPTVLELEFTESVLMENGEKTVSVLQSLKEMGIHLSIDDFGTGYSSLSYLKHFPVDRIKIDRSFVSGIGRNPGDAAIVAAVIALARTLKVRVMAEGVETRDQLDFLQKHGCSEVQGFLLGVPMATADLVRWLDMVPNPFESMRPAAL
jgi:diguanylate cyclase (GGDEF)-like protein/PAS domain S-box-containing protein